MRTRNDTLRIMLLGLLLVAMMGNVAGCHALTWPFAEGHVDRDAVGGWRGRGVCDHEQKR